MVFVVSKKKREQVLSKVKPEQGNRRQRWRVAWVVHLLFLLVFVNSSARWNWTQPLNARLLYSVVVHEQVSVRLTVETNQ